MTRRSPGPSGAAGDASTVQAAATADEVSAAGGVERGALGEWVRAGLLPAPTGRAVAASSPKWPRSSLKIAAFVGGQRELGCGLQDIQARIVAAFDDKVLEVLAEPRAQNKKKKTAKKRAKR